MRTVQEFDPDHFVSFVSVLAVFCYAANSEANHRRILMVENAFGSGGEVSCIKPHHTRHACLV